MRAREFITEITRRDLLKIGAGGLLGAAVGQGLSHLTDLDKAPLDTLQQPASSPKEGTAEKMVRLPNPLENSLKDYAVDQGIIGKELAQFLAQCSHETGNFKDLTEKGTPEYFRRKYDITGKHPLRAIKYGNIHRGDGIKFKGRGFIHLTWRGHYEDAEKYLGINLTSNENYLKAAEPKLAEKIAVWYWKKFVRRPGVDVTNTKQVTDKINKNEPQKDTQDRLTRYIHYLDALNLGNYEKDIADI